jgi:hypothetical protein
MVLNLNGRILLEKLNYTQLLCIQLINIKPCEILTTTEEEIVKKID